MQNCERWGNRGACSFCGGFPSPFLTAQILRHLRTSKKFQRLIGGAHGVLATVVSPEVFRQSIGMLRPHSTCALVGLPPGDFATPIFEVVLKRLTIRGSTVGTRMDLQESLELAASGRVRSATERQPLEAINDVFDRMRQGAINGRVVLAIGN